MNRLNVFALWLAVWTGAAGVFAAESSNPPASTKSSEPASYQVSNLKYGDLLRPEEANSADGTRLVLYPAQPWKCMTWKFHPAGEGTFFLQNHFTSKTFCADLKADPASPPVTQVPYAKATSECPRWRFTKLADGTYQVIEVKSGKALTAMKVENSPTVKVVVRDWREQDEQKWKLIPIDPKHLTM